VKFVAVSAGRAFAPAPENWQQPILDGITWAPLVGHPLARCTWLVWPANSHRRDLPHLVTAFETPGPDLEFARGVALAGTASLVGVRAEEATGGGRSPSDRLIREHRGFDAHVDTRVSIHSRARHTFPFSKTTIATIEKHGVAANRWDIHEHIGTQMDAFSHFIAGGMSLDQITVKNLIAPLAVIDIHERARRDADTMVTVDDIKQGKAAWTPAAGCRRLHELGLGCKGQ